MDISCYDVNGKRLRSLTQWDHGLSLMIMGVQVNPVPEIRYSNKKCVKAICVDSEVRNSNELWSVIPDELLQDPLPITVQVFYSYETGDSKTEYQFRIPVAPAAKPDCYAYTPSEVKTWTELDARIDKLENSVSGPGVTSVNGMTGDVEIDIPSVDKINESIDNLNTLVGDSSVSSQIEDAISKIKIPDTSVNGQNVALTAAQINALDGLFRVCAFVKDDVSPEYNAFRAAFRLDSSGGGNSGDTTENTMISISATYSGGPVPVGTDVSALTGVVVTAHYSDGSTDSVTGYTLSGTIAEGTNTITVAHQGLTATFAVTGVAAEELLLSDTNSANYQLELVFQGHPVAPAILISGYNADTHSTALSGKTVTKINVQVYTAGTITIGKCDITDLGTGSPPVLAEPHTYTAEKGMQTFYVDIQLGPTETLAFHADADSGRLAYTSYGRESQMYFIPNDQYINGPATGAGSQLRLSGEIYVREA